MELDAQEFGEVFLFVLKLVWMVLVVLMPTGGL